MSQDHSFELEPGELVQVESAIDPDLVAMAARVIGPSDDGGVRLALQSSDRARNNIGEGFAVRLALMRDRTAHYLIAVCTDVILGDDENGANRPMEIIISSPSISRLKERNDRKFVRLSLPIVFTFRVLESAAGLARGEERSATTRDIGAGGLRFETTLPLVPGDDLMVVVPITTDFVLETSARIVYLIPPDGETWHAFGIEFTGISEMTQQQIIENLWKRQVAERR
jgi:hypothetical protein